MYFVFIYENITLKPVEIVLKWKGVNEEAPWRGESN
jgi:hypothetical protein